MNKKCLFYFEPNYGDIFFRATVLLFLGIIATRNPFYLLIIVAIISGFLYYQFVFKLNKISFFDDYILVESPLFVKSVKTRLSYSELNQVSFSFPPVRGGNMVTIKYVWKGKLRKNSFDIGAVLPKKEYKFLKSYGVKLLVIPEEKILKLSS